LNQKLGALTGPIGMALFLIAVQLLALALVAPLGQYGLQAFPNPDSLWNPIIYIALILVFAVVFLIIIRFRAQWLIQAFIVIAVLSTLVYALFALGALLWPAADWLPLFAGSVVAAILLTGLMVVYPEWYIVDLVGVLTAAGAAAIFGVSLSIVPALLLLIVLAIYDFIAVYKTKHMITMANAVMDLKLPVLFVLPMRLGYSYRQSKGPKIEATGSEKQAYFMGLGDAVMPTILAVSANAFLEAPSIGFINIPALGSVLGTLVTYAALTYFVMKGKPQAGLPFLCTGAIVGFLIGCLAVGVNPFF